jgi:hypothetical protein
MVKGVTVERAQTYDLLLGRGVYLGIHDDYLPKGTVRDLLNYRPLTSVHEKMLDPRLYTTSVMDAAATPNPILGMIHFETLAGVGYVFGVSTRHILSFTPASRLFGGLNTAGEDFTSIYSTGTISSAGGGTATLQGAGVDGDGTAGLNLWPIKGTTATFTGDELYYGGNHYHIATATGSNPCTLTFTAAFPGGVVTQPYVIRRLLTARNTDTVTFCFFNQGVASGLVGAGPVGARIVMTDGGGEGAPTGAATTYDPILYWHPTLATFQPLPGVTNLRGQTKVTGMTAEVVVSYKDMLLAMNLKERTITGGAWDPWADATQRIRNTGIGSSEEWNLVGGVGYASWLDRPDTAGPIEGAIVWRDNVFVTKRDEMEILQFTGYTNPVFRVTKLLQDEGCQFRHGMANLREDVVMLGNRDIYLITESIPRKIGTNITTEMFADLDDGSKKQTFVVRWKGRNEMWFFYRSKGSAKLTAILGCDRAMVWNYEHDTWTKVDIYNPTLKHGFTYCGGIPYMQAAIPWSALNGLTWTDLAGIFWSGLKREVIETPFLGGQGGELVTYEGGDALMPGGATVVLTKWCTRQGYLETGLQDMGLPDTYKRLLNVFVEFQNKQSVYQWRVLSSSKKTDRMQMEHDTGWQDEQDQLDVTAKYFIIQVRQVNGEDDQPSEMAQIRLRYYLRGQR